MAKVVDFTRAVNPNKKVVALSQLFFLFLRFVWKADQGVQTFSVSDSIHLFFSFPTKT